MNTATTTQLPENYTVQHAYDGRYYPMVLESTEYEYFWAEGGDEVSFASEAEAVAYLSIQAGTHRIQEAYDGRYYPMVLDGGEYEHFWQENGDEVSFPTKPEAFAYIVASIQKVGC